MMTSSNGSIFRVTHHLCEEFTGHRWNSRTKASDAELWCFFHLRLNKMLSKQWWGCSVETPSPSLWRQCNMYPRISKYSALLISRGTFSPKNPSFVSLESEQSFSFTPFILCSIFIRSRYIEGLYYIVFVWSTNRDVDCIYKMGVSILSFHSTGSFQCLSLYCIDSSGLIPESSST